MFSCILTSSMASAGVLTNFLSRKFYVYGKVGQVWESRSVEKFADKSPDTFASVRGYYTLSGPVGITIEPRKILQRKGAWSLELALEVRL